jgi:hypothetical protein
MGGRVGGPGGGPSDAIVPSIAPAERGGAGACGAAKSAFAVVGVESDVARERSAAEVKPAAVPSAAPAPPSPEPAPDMATMKRGCWYVTVRAGWLQADIDCF